MTGAIRKFFKGLVPEVHELAIEPSSHSQFGHYTTNIAMRLAHGAHQTPIEIAKALAEEIRRRDTRGFFESVEAAPPGFINFKVSRKALQEVFRAIRRAGERYGRGKEKGTVIVEYSDPNIAKRMHVGHLRATIIGDALANIHSFLGYRVVRWNYLGDWGTQFGKMIAAYKLWGKKSEVIRNPLETLQSLYVKFHEVMKVDPSLEVRGREEFKKLEDGNSENRKLWQWFKRESLKEFRKIYAALGVRFDTFLGESFYEKKLQPFVASVLERGIARESEGSVIIPLDADKLPPALIRKSDGASLYLTRDILNLQYRLLKWKPKKILYVVGNEQSLHFEQLFAAARILGIDAPAVHVKYGLVLGENAKKLATREGNAILLEGVIEKAIRLAREAVEKKNSKLSSKEKNSIAKAVGIGALKYNDLKENRHSDIVFDWERMLSLEGRSAPYLLYTYARLRSILRKAGKLRPARVPLEGAADLGLVLLMAQFPDAIQKSAETYFPHYLADYLYRLAKDVNHFYHTEPVLQASPSLRSARLDLVVALSLVMKQGLGLLGIRVVEKM